MPDGTFLAELDERQMREWLVHGTRTDDYAPLTLLPEPSIPSQIERLWAAQESAVQQRFKRAVCSAIAEWTATSPLSALRTLTFVAAYVRASDVVSQLTSIVRTRLTPRIESKLPEDEEILDTIGVLLAVISGFAPLPQATAAAESFYYDARLPLRFAPISLHALCRSQPERYPDYLPRMIRLMERHPQLYHTALILDRLVETITPPLFAKHFAELDREVKSTFIALLKEAPKVRARIEPDEKTYNLITSYGDSETMYNCPVPEPDREPKIEDYRPVYNQLINGYSGTDELEALLMAAGLQAPISRRPAEFQ